MPPHHPIWGHLKVIAKVMKELPPDLMPTVALGEYFRRHYPHLDQAFYLDQWPFSKPMLILLSPDTARQITQGVSLLKDPLQGVFLAPLTGGYDIDTMEGDEWKFWHNVFSPGFRVSNITALVPSFIEMVNVFCERLREQARKESQPFYLAPMAYDLTMDLSAKSIMDHDLHSQTEYNDFAAALASQLRWLHYKRNTLADLNFIRPLVQRYNTWRMDTYINAVLSRKSKLSPEEKKGAVSVLDVANVPHDPVHVRILPKVIRSQVKFMMLAGYDTTGSSIVFMTHRLTKHPDILARVRAEHDEILGPDIKAAPKLIAANPKLLNLLPYTTAVMKESLRFYPPGATTRLGQRDFNLVIDRPDANNTAAKLALPTEGFICMAIHHGIHHNPRYWERPHEFIPERFLEKGKDDPLQPPVNGWRPFERGPRACIGQEMALAEIKMVCAMTAREFDFRPAYDKIGPQPAHTVDGDHVYLVSRGGAANPSGFYPCQITFTDRVQT
ncbi:cytochrome p450 71b25 [Colletotrichum karsti]|uniref:Cytochrome p450 71b25 n=1 Tax=Colletotrichum karsti TaxID=1095194 RepID=A0A9P6I2X2_9PEZI|nr:cytochrome p450 71b25 [Colletotrichum karsti]KAF9870955.1 cytochrome p450 71b25 [Colletotrichum karsti]